ncbi:hypothetical protein MYX76_18075, partial [Desulfobacterota bacterium AH_259_B03_O07]|nr:hypothetical protein [Desulfobacterota bacterium AH_259_B03_O07]
EEVDKKLNNVNNALLAQIADLKDRITKNESRSSSNARIVQLTQKIDDLANVTLRNITVNGVTGLTNADIPDSITASSYLPLSGGTLTGNLTGTDITLSGDLTVTGVQTFSGALTVSSFSATSTAATSTIAGGFNVGSGGLVYDFSSKNVGIGTASPKAQFVLAGQTQPRISFISTHASANPAQWSITNEGNVNRLRFGTSNADDSNFIYRMVIESDTGQMGLNDTTPDAMLDIISGDAATITLRLEHAASPTADYFQIGTNGSTNGDILTIDSSGNLGIGTTSPASLLSVHGGVLIAGTTTVKALVATSTLFVGGTT